MNTKLYDIGIFLCGVASLGFIGLCAFEYFREETKEKRKQDREENDDLYWPSYQELTKEVSP